MIENTHELHAVMAVPKFPPGTPVRIKATYPYGGALSEGIASFASRDGHSTFIRLTRRMAGRNEDRSIKFIDVACAGALIENEHIEVING